MPRKTQETKGGATATTRRGHKPGARKTLPAAGVTHEMIAQRAYEIHLSEEGGSEIDDWLRAERELLDSA